jgi:hypothetical protein
MEEIEERKGWFARNWKWVVPTGGCLIIVVLLVVFAGGLFYTVANLTTDSQAYIDSMEKVKTNELVIEQIGEPIEQNGISSSSFNYTNGYSSAELTIPIKGPKGEATIRVEGGGVDENWTYDVMEVYVKGSDEVIYLLEDDPLLD